jgi:hypothetical protein
MLKLLDKENLSMLPLLQTEEKESLLSVIKAFLKSRSELAKYAEVELYNIEVQEAEVEYQKGSFISHEDLLKQIKSW